MKDICHYALRDIIKEYPEYEVVVIDDEDQTYSMSGVGCDNKKKQIVVFIEKVE